MKQKNYELFLGTLKLIAKSYKQLLETILKCYWTTAHGKMPNKNTVPDGRRNTEIGTNKTRMPKNLSKFSFSKPLLLLQLEN